MSLVEIWVGGLDGGAERAARHLPLLSPDEIEKADRYAFPHLRDEYIIGRGLTRSILGSQLGVDPRCLRFLYGDRGKPWLADSPAVHFNVSHSKGLIVCAVTEAGPAGVDVEQVRAMDDMMGIAKRFFSESEARTLELLPEEARAAAFFECWTRKEAFIKATGEGMARGLADFAVSFGPGTTPRFERIDGPPDDPAAWSLRSFVPAANFAGALAMRARIDEVRLIEISVSTFG